jgi:hypothetical protein
LCSIHSFCVHFFWAYCCVHSRAVLMASGWFSCACVRNAATCPVRLTKKWHRTYLPLLRHGLVKRILWVRCTEQCLDAQQDRADLKGGRPVVLQYVEADATQSVDVRVIDASQEAYPRWAHGVVVGQEELEVELAACYPVNTRYASLSSVLLMRAHPRNSCRPARPPRRRSILRSRHVAPPRYQAPARSVIFPSP